MRLVRLKGGEEAGRSPRPAQQEREGRARTPRSDRPPVSPETLMRMATHYLGRYSASTARLREVLARKIRRRCELRDLPQPDEAATRALIDDVVGRLARTGLIDDAAYGRGRAAALARKGWPAWRIRGDLQRQGVDLEQGGVAEATDVDEKAQATRLAERKRLGPYRPGAREPYRDRDIRSLVRAGFPVSMAKAVVDGEAG